MKNALPAALCAALFLAVSACKKEEPAPAPADPNAEPAPVQVLRPGVAFGQYATKMLAVPAGVGSLPGSYGFYDFSIDRSNQLHLLYWTEFQSQQGPVRSSARNIINLGSGSVVPIAQPDVMLQSTGAAQGSFAQVLEYQPYTGNLAAFITTGQRFGFYSQGSWGGYFTSSPFPQASSAFGYTGGMGYYNAHTDHGTNKNYMTVNPNPASPVRLMYANFEYKTPAMDNPYLVNFPEPRYSTQGRPAAITVAANAVEAYRFSYGSPLPAAYTRTGRLVPSGYTSQEYTTLRHYSPDGTQMGMLVRGATTNQCWTYTYNFTTDVLGAVLSAADLPYSGPGSDVDLDEDGNVYYTGVAGNGTKPTGVSVYKRSASGTSVVGTDDFLRTGEVVKLHYLSGKVHLVVQSPVVGREPWSQFGFVSQN